MVERPKDLNSHSNTERRLGSRRNGQKNGFPDPNSSPAEVRNWLLDPRIYGKHLKGRSRNSGPRSHRN